MENKKFNEQFEAIKPLNWEEVLEIWKNNEAGERHWAEYYRNEGFKSWEDWREKYTEPIRKLNKKWRLVKVADPLKSVPNFHGGPYNGWAKNFYGGRDLPTFGEMKEHPAALRYLENLPSKTTMIAWNTEAGVVIIEGMHRCAAIAKAARERRELNLELFMALADCPLSEIPDFREDREPSK